MKVTKEDIPPLLPGGFYREMGMIADYPKQTLTWAALGHRQSQMIQLPSDHIARRIDECPVQYGLTHVSNQTHSTCRQCKAIIPL